MKKALMISFLLSCFSIVFSQKIEILRQADPSLVWRHKNKATRHLKLGFIALEDSINKSNLKFVATIRIRERNPVSVFNCEYMYQGLNLAANNLGANAFSLKEFFVNDTSRFASYTIDAYFVSDSVIAFNRSLKPTNCIFVFPDIQNPRKGSTFSINDRKVTLKDDEYLRYTPRDGEKVCITKGSFLGDQKCLTCHKNQHATYIKVEGVTGDAHTLVSGGNLTDEDEDLGELMIKTFFTKPVNLDANSK
jgi:hypothetical protein